MVETLVKDPEESSTSSLGAPPEAAVQDTTEPVSQISRLASLAPPHQVIVYLLNHLSFKKDEIVNRRKTSLDALFMEILTLLPATPVGWSEIVSSWTVPLCKDLRARMGTLDTANRRVRRDGSLRDQPCGTTCLEDYFSQDPSADVDEWIQNIRDMLIVARYLGGDEQAFLELHNLHEKPIMNFFRAQVYKEAAEDLTQETWIKVLEKLPQFDPSKGCFKQFWRFWARIKLLQFWRKEGAYRRFFVELATLRERFPGMEDDGEIIGLLMEAQSGPLNEELAPDPSEFDELMLQALGADTPPHQAIAFIWVILLGRKPARLVEQHSQTNLADLLQHLEAELVNEFSPNEAIVHLSLRYLRQIMVERQKGCNVMKEAMTRRTYSRLLSRVVAETHLADYFTPNDGPWTDSYLEDCSQKITNFWISVKRRVISYLAKKDPK